MTSSGRKPNGTKKGSPPRETIAPEVTIASLGSLIPDDRNANKGKPRGRSMLEDSLRELGAGRSLLIDKKGRIIAGNKTHEVAGDIGLDNVIVVKTNGQSLVAVQRMDLDLDTPEGRRMALFDNRTSEIGLDWDVDVLEDFNNELDLSLLWTKDELEALIALSREGEGEGENEGEGEARIGGQLLKLLSVSIDPPKHRVEMGQVWHVGPHLLIITDVPTGWAEYLPWLKEPTDVFAPYPGPYLPLSIKAQSSKLVMVQPDDYIAGHILDAYAMINGEEAIRREK